MARNTKRKVRRRGRRKKRGFASWSLGKKIGAVLGGTFLAVAVIGMVILASKMNKLKSVKLNTDKLNISDEVQHEEGYTNVALFGLDSRENDLGKGNRSDTIMIASLNNDTKEVKLVSIYRDTLLELDDGSYNKANAAYAFGGPEGAVSLINRNLDMNIEKYVTVNFNALVDVIDAVGGLDLELTHDEVVHMNNYCVETSKLTGKDYTPIEKPEPKPEDQEATVGTYHLNGVQVTSYCRIRYTASLDMGRTERQRRVLGMLFDKAKIAGLSSIFKIMDDVFPMVTTSLSKQDILGLIPTLVGYKFTDSTGFPQKYKFSNIKGSIIVPTDLENNVVELHKFLYNDQDYTPSSEVVARSNKILEIVGGESKLDDASTATSQQTDTTNTADTFVWSGDNSSGGTDYSGDYSYDNDYDNSYDNGGSYDDNTGGGDYDNGGGDDDNTGGGDYDNGGGDNNTGGDDGGGDDGGGDYSGGDDTGGDTGFDDGGDADSGTSSEEE